MRDPTARRVAVVVYDGVQLLDLAGPLEVLHTASLLRPEQPYELVVCSPGGDAVRAASGVTVAVDASLHAVARRRTPLDTLLVTGGLGSRALEHDEGALRDLRRASARASRTASVCTGALLLAAAGLLEGRRCTTHWASCDDLAVRHPDVQVEPDRIYVRDGDLWTSAGVTAGIDLALALVEADHGPDVAHEVAGWLVVFVRRPGGQAQFSAQLRAHPARSPAIAELQRWLPDHLGDDLGVDALAARSAMSTRTFARAFARETGSTPAAYVESLRVEAAQRLLETTDLTVGAIARAVGIRHAETLHRAFARRLGTSPDRYRQHFARRAS